MARENLSTRRLKVQLVGEEFVEVERLRRSPTACFAFRARVVAELARGQLVGNVARQERCSMLTVLVWAQRFLRDGPAALERYTADAPTLTAEQRSELLRIEKRGGRIGRRASAILALANGLLVVEVADALHMAECAVRKWDVRFLEAGVAGIENEFVWKRKRAATSVVVTSAYAQTPAARRGAPRVLLQPASPEKP